MLDESGTPTVLRGVCFGNDVWSEPSEPVRTHHDERDFERIHGWGMDLVRFYLNYQLFEEDEHPYRYKPSGFRWLDDNVAWARRHHVRLILNVHVPQGGFQSNGAGDGLWHSAENQDRFVALWRAIADRYRDEPVIAGYDLLNEPRPDRARSQWSELATRLVRKIREVDARHLIVVERTNSVGDDWSSDADMNFFLVPDPNVLYEFHFYSPIEYTHQFASWIGMGEGGKYPDESIVSSAGLTWYDWSHTPAPPPSVPSGDTDFRYYESPAYAVTDPKVKAIGVSLVSELNAGTAYFDDIVVKELDASGKFLRNVFSSDAETLKGWYFWKAGAKGEAALAEAGHGGAHSLSITGTDHDANLTNTAWRFAPVAGHRYVIGAWIKGVAVSDVSRPDPRGTWTQTSRALARLDYYTSDGPALARNKAALAAELDRYVAWGKLHQVPLYLGELGCIHYCFEGERGGSSWVSDMLDLLNERQISFTYHAYHEENFGVFQSPASVLPDPASGNDELIATFQRKLAPRP